MTAVAEFEALYRANVAAVTAYFARRSAEPQTVADLTADTFVQAITSFATFDPRKGTPRAWVFGIARRIYAAHCQAHSQQRSRVERLAGRRELAPDEVGDLIDRIDAERAGRALVTGLTTLPAADRAVVELVDLAGLQPKEAAQVLGIAPGTLRMLTQGVTARRCRPAGHGSSTREDRCRAGRGSAASPGRRSVCWAFMPSRTMARWRRHWPGELWLVMAMVRATPSRARVTSATVRSARAWPLS